MYVLNDPVNRKTIVSVLILVCLGSVAVVSADGTRGVPRKDLVGKYWRQLPPTRYPGFVLPLTWKTKKKFELRLFEPDFEKYIVTITEQPSYGKGNEGDALIVAALDFATLKEGELPEQDCYYRNIPSCDGRLCEGLLIGVVTQNGKRKEGTYVPTEVWKITSKGLKFEKVSSKNVVCKPQSYAE